MQEMMLTEREQEILRLLAEGLSDREIGGRLYLTVGTVKWYNRQIFSKLHARNRTHAIEEARRRGILGESPSLPAVASAEEPALSRSTLPAPVTSFVGRTREVQEITRVLGEARLVTLTGAPGTGKTRLALEVAARMAPSFADGVWFVSLAPLSDPALVPGEICRVLGLQESASRSPRAVLAAYTRDKALLLVLDNFEHLLPATPLLAELLAGAPRLVVLATSRERLRLYGEQEFPVPPLDFPDLDGPLAIDVLSRCESVALFVHRARAAQPGFVLDAQNASATAQMCVRLDGLPLAIELAAARIRFHSPQSLLLRLSSRLETLNAGPRDLPSRQQTLRTTLAWSYDRLEPDEQRLFARLGVFAGGCTLDDAAAVCGADLALAVSDGIESLAEKNLLQVADSGQAGPRVTMLETMREYALDLMQRSGEIEPMRTRHMAHFLAMAEASARASAGPQTAVVLRRLEAEHDNLRAALEWSLAADASAQASLHMIGALATFWRDRGYYTEARSWLDRALQLPGAAEPTRARAAALSGMGSIAHMQGDYAASQAFYTEVLAYCRQVNDDLAAARALVGLGDTASEVGDYDRALVCFREAHALAQEVNDSAARAEAATLYGFALLRKGDTGRVRPLLEEGLALYQMDGDRLGIALALSGLGELALREQRLADATSFLEESLAIRRTLGQPWGIAATLGSLAWVAMRQHDWARAEDLLAESLSIRREIGDPGGLAWCLERLAEMARLRADPERAVRVFAAAAALRAGVDSVIDPSDRDAYTVHIDGLRATLGSRFDSLWDEGQAMSAEQAVACALTGRNL